MKKHEGYTLVEMVISIAVGMVIIAAIYAAVNMGQRSTVNVEQKGGRPSGCPRLPWS